MLQRDMPAAGPGSMEPELANSDLYEALPTGIIARVCQQAWSAGVIEKLKCFTNLRDILAQWPC